MHEGDVCGMLTHSVYMRCVYMYMIGGRRDAWYNPMHHACRMCVCSECVCACDYPADRYISPLGKQLVSLLSLPRP